MSNKKSRKNRQPNVPMQTAPTAAPNIEGKAGGNVVKMNARSTQGTETINADYTHVFGDLRRIMMLAGLLVVGLIALSFFIK